MTWHDFFVFSEAYSEKEIEFWKYLGMTVHGSEAYEGKKGGLSIEDGLRMIYLKEQSKKT